MYKCIFLTLLTSFYAYSSYSQSVSISETGALPDSSAILDVRSTTKGLLAPKMTTANMNAIAGPAKGLLIYNTTNNQFWTNVGTAGSPNWRQITSNAWGLAGNLGTVPASNFIGTTDNKALLFRTNNVFSGALDPIDKNVYFGYQAGLNTGTGGHNVAIGSSALEENSLASHVVAVGDSALHTYTGNEGRNTALGSKAGLSHISGSHNTFVGNHSGYSSTYGFNNTALGAFAMYSNTTGANNLAIGTNALNSALTYSKNIAIGDSAMFNHIAGMENTVIGYKAMSEGTNNFYSTYVGYQAGLNSNSGIYNVGVGFHAMDENGGDFNVGVGGFALSTNTSGNYNTAIGYAALSSNTTGDGNVAIGELAGWQNEAGNYNVAIGHHALKDNDNTDRNIAIGDSSLYDLNAGTGENTVIGASAGRFTTNGNNNCFYGNQSAFMNTTGDANVAIGNRALLATTVADGNTAVGRIAGDAYDLGNNNTLIGGFTDVSASGFTESTALGYNALITASNQVRVGVSTTGSIGGYSGWTTLPSDSRYKKNIQQNVHGLDFILQLRPVTYNLDVQRLQEQCPSEIAVDQTLLQQTESVVHTGFIAQEVEAAARDIGYDFSGVDAPKNESDMYGLRYAEFVVPLVKAVQEQQEQIEFLKKQNTELMNRIEELENK